MKNEIMVSVGMITYNHGKYIRQALDSILMQKVNFKFEIVVGDDCSPDNTQEILLEYKENYPSLFKLLLREENTGRPTLNYYGVIQNCDGKYIASLEGDDYWTDPFKLQEQFAFLEKHSDYIAITHNHIVVDEYSRKIPNAACLSIYPSNKGEFTLRDLIDNGKLPGQSATLMYRNIFKNPKYDYSIMYKAHDFMGDITLCPLLLLQGNMWRMEEVMSIRRCVQEQGSTNLKSIVLKRDVISERCYAQKKIIEWCKENFNAIEYVDKKSKVLFYTALIYFLKNCNGVSFRLLSDMYSLNSKKFALIGYTSNRAIYQLFRVVRKYAVQLWRNN